MRSILVVLVLAAAALAAPNYEPITSNYHEDIGIPEAARIKAAEEALDFDGSRIVGGSQSWLGQFPHFGGLVITLNDGRTSVCGSSLVSKTRLVSAAHCWRTRRVRAIQFIVVLGSTTLFSGGTRITTNQVDVHAQYNDFSLRNDVLVVRISPVTLTNNIKPIKMASGYNDYAGVKAYAAGFGLTSDDGYISPYQVKSYVRLVVITNDECQRVFGTFIIHTTLCTSGAGGRSTCRGDSGGPLQINIGPEAELIGITSFGASTGCQLEYPAAFSRVTAFHSWISARM